MRLRKIAAGALAAVGVGVVMPLTLVASEAHAFAPGGGRTGVIAAKGAAVGTKLLPLRMALSVTPWGLVANAAVIGASMYLSTDSGQKLVGDIWDKATGKVTVNGETTTPAPRAGLVVYCTTIGTVPAGASWSQAGGIPLSITDYGTNCGGGTTTNLVKAWCVTTAVSTTFPVLGTVRAGRQSNGLLKTVTSFTDPCSGIDTAAKPEPFMLEFYGTGEGSSYRGQNSVWWAPNRSTPGFAHETILTTRKLCKDSAGVITAVRKSGAVGVDQAPTDVECPAGTTPTEVQLWSSRGAWDAGGANMTRLISSTTIPDSFRSEYSRCIGAGAVGCHMWVEVDGEQCTHSLTACANWWSIKDTARVRCLWGPVGGASTEPYVLPSGDCAPIRHAYVTEHGAVADPKRQPQTMPVPATDPNGTPWPITEPYPGHDPVDDPVTTPAPQPQPSPTATTTTNPGGDPSSTPGTGGFPTSGTQPAPGPGQPANCWGAAWSWNPVDWVFVPVKCALQWAFVPSAAVQASAAARFQTALEGTSVGAWSAALNAYPAAFSVTSGGCMGPALVLPAPFSTTIYPAAACENPTKMLADVTKIGLSVVLAVGGVWACVRLILAGIGYQTSQGGDE